LLILFRAWDMIIKLYKYSSTSEHMGTVHAILYMLYK
jgi:hypothetical protein